MHTRQTNTRATNKTRLYVGTTRLYTQETEPKAKKEEKQKIGE